MEDIQKNQVGMALFLSAYMHQGDDLFSAESRGKQCAFMSLSAILTAENMPLIDWSKTTFNNVLLQGLGGKRGVRSAECGVRSAECGVRSAECGVRSAECFVYGCKPF